MFGALEEAREILEAWCRFGRWSESCGKSLMRTNEDLFGPEDQVDEINHFLPNRLPGFLVARKNPASQGVIMVKSAGQAVLAIRPMGQGRLPIGGPS